jgi:hypothetical protein
MPTSPDPRAGDMLTRTTLETDDGLSALTIAGLVGALRHVPGVLLADVAAGSCRAVVAHDAAVPPASLLAAAEGVGVRARIFADNEPAPVSSATVAAPFRSINGLLTIFAEVLLLFALLYVIDPRLIGSPSFVPIVLASVWGCLVARLVFGRRK